MTPIGHAAVGYVVARAHGRLDPRRDLSSWHVVLGSMLPDVDFALVWAPRFNVWHRVVTHNLLFVAVASLLLGAVLARWRGHAMPRTVAAFVLGGMLHLFVDACMDGNASNGIGVALLWPFDDRMWSPFNLVAAADSGPGWRDPWRALAGSAKGLVWELPWIAAAVALLLRRKRHEVV
jgi:membrane-bound metal-dependent hydrolase YbcI (DUF457 family)